MATMQEKPLGQARENSTNAVQVYSPASGVTGIIKSVILCNNTASPATYRLFMDADGTTYDQSTALAYDAIIQANETLVLGVYWPLEDLGSFAYGAGTANAITITLFGVEITG